MEESRKRAGRVPLAASVASAASAASTSVIMITD